MSRREVNRKNWIPKLCMNCNQSFLVNPYKIKIGYGKFCSRSCSTKYHNRGYFGENNPNYKGGISKVKSKYTRRFEAKFPEKAKAQKLVRYLVKQGKLLRKPCEECGTTEKIHAHHDDYSKPLEIRWLCDKHHRIVHGATC